MKKTDGNLPTATHRRSNSTREPYEIMFIEDGEANGWTFSRQVLEKAPAYGKHAAYS